jgi:hypothetical protein
MKDIFNSLRKQIIPLSEEERHEIFLESPFDSQSYKAGYDAAIRYAHKIINDLEHEKLQEFGEN